jgi:hypothetical protein
MNKKIIVITLMMLLIANVAPTMGLIKQNQEYNSFLFELDGAGSSNNDDYMDQKQTIHEKDIDLYNELSKINGESKRQIIQFFKNINFIYNFKESSFVQTMMMFGANQVQSCTTKDGKPGQCRLYLYWIVNVGDTTVPIDTVKIEFPGNLLDCSDIDGPPYWSGSCEKENPPRAVAWQIDKSHYPHYMSGNARLGYFVVRTECIAIEDGGIGNTMEGLQNWSAKFYPFPDDPEEGPKVQGKGQVRSGEVRPEKKESGPGHSSSHPPENSIDKNFSTYSIIAGGPNANWIVYDLGIVKKIKSLCIFASDHEYIKNPSTIDLWVGIEDNGTCDQYIGQLNFPPLSNCNMAEVNLSEVLEKRYVKIAFVGKWDDEHHHSYPVDAELSEVEFPYYLKKANTPPEKPSKPDGLTNGKTGETYYYSTSTIDIDGDDIYYLFDWGDGKYSGWNGAYKSGEIVNVSHIWENPGDYEIKVIAKDQNNFESEWSNPLSVTIPKSKTINTPLILQKLFQRFTFFEKILNQIV